MSSSLRLCNSCISSWIICNFLNKVLWNQQFSPSKLIFRTSLNGGANIFKYFCQFNQTLLTFKFAQTACNLTFFKLIVYKISGYTFFSESWSKMPFHNSDRSCFVEFKNTKAFVTMSKIKNVQFDWHLNITLTKCNVTVTQIQLLLSTSWSMDVEQ